uniref:Uncharacterized protein n=1 Tax=Scophthalmus maximus TaxID=52904 RepID=A0A8D3C8D0_SCOMX
MALSVCRYRSWRADGASEITREASFRALEAFISPSEVKLKSPDAPVTFALASLVASASAAMALCSLDNTMVPNNKKLTTFFCWEGTR